MEIVKVDPDEKYVLLFPGATGYEVEEILSALRAFMEDDIHVLMSIYGINVTIVPVSQIEGYKVLSDRLTMPEKPRGA